MPEVTPGSIIAFGDATTARASTVSGITRGVVRRLRRDPGATVALLFLAALALIAAFAPLLAPYDPTQQFDIVASRLQPPSLKHWFGTDAVARDVLSRVIYGARISLGISVLAVMVAMLLGTAWGAVAGFAGGMVDGFLMRVVDACLAIPRILLLLAVVALWGGLSVPALVLLLGLTGWFHASRLVRAEVLAARERDFVAAARSLGASPARILVRHVIPHAIPPVTVAAALAVGQLVVVEAGLAFLGFGVPAPHPSWGNIIRDGYQSFSTAWWLAVFPGFALAATVVAVNVVADRLREALNPRQLPGP